MFTRLYLYVLVAQQNNLKSSKKHLNLAVPEGTFREEAMMHCDMLSVLTPDMLEAWLESCS